METIIPEPTTPLGPETTDLDVIETEKEEPQPLHETDEAKCLLDIVNKYEQEEEFVRLYMTRKWRKALHYWNNFQYLAWDELAHDWTTAEDIAAEDPQADIDPALYAKVINVYKAHGEILIGALTSGVPATRFFPKDADDHEDVMAAKARSKIAELIQRHNKVRLLLMKSLFLLYNCGLAACYNENKSDYRFGSIKSPEYSDVPVINRQSYCPSCGFELGADKFDRDDEEALAMPPGEVECPQCGTIGPPEIEDIPDIEEREVGVKTEPKNRECLEVFGPLNVKIPIWARDQVSIPYLILETDEHVALLSEIYPELEDKISPVSYPDTYEREYRVPTHYKHDFPKGLCYVKRVWLRRWALNYAPPDKAKALKEKYPEGVYVVIINGDIVAEIVPDKLDDHWTISEHPLSEVLHAEPIGSSMIPIQDITNELANLTLETIEFGIPEVFADPRVLDFEAYKSTELRPGQVSPASAPSGQGLASGFHEVKATTLSREVELFANRMDNAAQFVMGSYPSIYGGAQEGGGGTAKEYELSKASALQRLSTTWLILQEWWVKVIQKSVESFIQNMREEKESYVIPKGSNFINVWIDKSELSGDIGEVEPEISETFPVSWTQKRDIILNLIQMQNEDIAAVIRHPENAGLIASTIGLPELYIPGDDDRNKQLYEISLLIQEEPILGPPSPMSSDGLMSTVEVSQEVDNHVVEAEVCRAWLKSEVGQETKRKNPGGYMNVLTHLKEHLFMIAMMAPPPEEEDEGEDEMTEEVGV
jgi:hypothetical protein